MKKYNTYQPASQLYTSVPDNDDVSAGNLALMQPPTTRPPNFHLRRRCYFLPLAYKSAFGASGIHFGNTSRSSHLEGLPWMFQLSQCGRPVVLMQRL